MEEAPSGFERRLVLRMLSHWREARGEAEYPSLSAVIDQDIGDVWGACMLLRVPDEGEPTFIFFGESFFDAGARGLCGQPVSAAPADSLVGNAVRIHREVLTRKVPVTRGDAFVDAAGRQILYRSIVLPLSESGEKMDMFLVAANCKTA